MRSFLRAGVSGSVLLLSLARTASATEPEAVVWYRASDECPAGPAFLAKVPQRAPRARLAEAGDHIDFLVTLLAGRGETVGRLERQTQRATVAIRELRDASCEQVADALALSLALALEPASPSSPAEAPAPTEVAVSTSTDTTTATTPVAEAEPPVPAAGTPLPPAPDRATAPPTKDAAAPLPTLRRRRSARAWSAGVDAGVLSGVLPTVAFRGSVLVTAPTPLAALPALALRFGASAALGSASTEVGSVERFIVAGHAEACPWRSGGAGFGVAPCAALEVGVTGASDSRPTSRHGVGLWAAPGAMLDASAHLAGPISLGLSGGGLVPLVRSELAAGSKTLYRSEIVNFVASAGVAVRLE